MTHETNWNAVTDLIRHTLEMELARHPAVGAALSFTEGEALITKLSGGLTYDIHKLVDPTYDTQ